MQTPRILLVNANTTAAVTDRLLVRAKAFLGTRAEIAGVTAAFGADYIASAPALAVAGHAVLEAASAAIVREPTIDACVLACFGDPGLAALREAVAFPCVGMAEAAIMTALQIGNRFGIVTVGERWPGLLHDMLRLYGFQAHCAGIVAVSGDALGLFDRRDETLRLVAEAVSRLVREQRPDAVILGGASIAGVADELRSTSPVPLIDSLDAACAQAEALARLVIRPKRHPSRQAEHPLPQPM